MAKIINVTAVTGNYPNGQRIDRARVTYDCRLSEDVSAAAFAVADRTITGIHTEGDTVTLFLDIQDDMARLIPPDPPRKHKPGEKPSGPPRDLPPVVLRPVQVVVTQVEAISAADGSEIPADGVSRVSDRTEEPIVEDFIQGEYAGLPYSLYVPKDLQEGREYPLVMFIHDAGPCGPDPKITLAQGCGAISFAEPEWQAEHPCFVLAPQIDRHVHLTNDDFSCSKEIEDIKALLDYVVDHNPVDRKRIYTTGQSMGCMSSCELNIRYPDLFAASLLVAGQWSPEKMAASCPHNNFWILVSEGDFKAFPGMTAVTDAMEQAGAVVARYRWDGDIGGEKLTEYARNAMMERANVRFTVFNGSTVVPEGTDINPGSNHVCTWPVAYQVRGLKEWLFSHSK